MGKKQWLQTEKEPRIERAQLEKPIKVGLLVIFGYLVLMGLIENAALTGTIVIFFIAPLYMLGKAAWSYLRNRPKVRLHL